MGRSAYTLRRLMRVGIDGMFFRTTVLLHVVTLGGFVIAFVGGILALYNIAYYFLAGQPSGYTSLAVLELLLSGAIITSVGVVGLYVGRIFEQVKFRPLFIISRQIDVTEEQTEEFSPTAWGAGLPPVSSGPPA